jgi:hypothetical protein
MCPDPKLISIYIDGELPSPWKEKMTSHLAECSDCKEKFENFNGFFNRAEIQEEQKLMEEAKDRVWRKLQLAKRPVQRVRNFNVWQRKLSIPIPAAAAAAVLLVFATVLWMRGGSSNNNPGYANLPVVPMTVEGTGFNVSLEETIPNIMTASDLSSVIKSLGGGGDQIIILNLPESSSFFSSGEPAIINAADYTRRP